MELFSGIKRSQLLINTNLDEVSRKLYLVGKKAPKCDELCDSIYIAFLKCQNHKNDEEIGG